MAIVTSDQVKTILQITGTDFDTAIGALIPLVQKFILDYTKNEFRVPRKYITSTEFVFTHNDSAADTITDPDENFIDAGLTDGCHVIVSGSLDNDGVYKVATVVAGTLTLDASEVLTSESSDEYVRIQRVSFPDSLQLIAAKLIGFNLERGQTRGIKSEHIGSYSVQYSNEYPASLLKELNIYRKVFP